MLKLNDKLDSKNDDFISLLFLKMVPMQKLVIQMTPPLLVSRAEREKKK